MSSGSQRVLNPIPVKKNIAYAKHPNVGRRGLKEPREARIPFLIMKPSSIKTTVIANTM
ncbi:MAG: hypothetical protein QXL96_12295 [Ignisphaera sp.]